MWLAERVVILAIALFPGLCAAGYIASKTPPDPEVPAVSLTTGRFVMNGFYVVRVDSVVTSEAYESKSNHNGTSQLGPCTFGNGDTPLNINSGGWYGAISQPQGQASGSLDCRLHANFTVLDTLPGNGPPDAFFAFLNVATRVLFDPATEIASYGWDLGLTLTSLDSGRTRTPFRERASRYCGPDSPSDCNRFFDFHSFGFEFPLSVGERVAADLFLNLRFDLRAIPEPSSLALLGTGLLLLLTVGRRPGPKGS